MPAGRPAPQVFSSPAGEQVQRQLDDGHGVTQGQIQGMRREPAQKTFSRQKLADFLARYGQGHGLTYDEIMRDWPDRPWSEGGPEYDAAYQALTVCMGQLRKKTEGRLKVAGREYLLQSRRVPGPTGHHVQRFFVVSAGVTL